MRYRQLGIGGPRVSEVCLGTNRKENVKPATRAYAELARRYGLSPATLALAFVYRRWCVSSTIIGATTMEQLKENISAYDVELSAQLLKEIDALHLRYTNPAPQGPVGE